jgi:hypothetical protein
MPGRIRRFHVQFIDQVLSIHQRIKSEPRDSLAGFKWNSECFWSIEQWLQDRPGREEELAEAIRDGVIGLSGTYLHFTELIDVPILRKLLRRAAVYGNSIGVRVDSALSADVNGFSWGTVDAMAEQGIEHLMTCVHSHHGLAPIGKRQMPFYWESPSGAKILVWNGEHYHLGNVLGLVPRALTSYAFKDELHPATAGDDQWFYAEKRLPRYLRQLELDEYPYRVLPIGVSGMNTDNAPPYEAIAGFVHEWNQRHGRRIELHMATISEFFADFHKAAADGNAPSIPTYRGDWPDWWSDGVAASPDQTAIFRESQRVYRAMVETPGIEIPAPQQRDLENRLALYAEHTFNHSDAMRYPWDLKVKMVGGEKKAAAYELGAAVERLVDDVQDSMGQLLQTPGQALHYKVFNPTALERTDTAMLYLEGMEFNTVNIAPRVFVAGQDQPIPIQKTEALRGLWIAVPLHLKPYETISLELRSGIPTLHFNQRCSCDALTEGLPPDVAGAEADRTPVIATVNELSTPAVRIELDGATGVRSIIDRKTGRNLIRGDAEHAAFTPVYEITPALRSNDASAMIEARRNMGRNRKGPGVQRSAGQLSGIEVVEVGPLFGTVALHYTMRGVSLYSVLLTAWADLPRVDVRVRMHKDSVWDAENVYVSLPFGLEHERELWIEKAGALVRPWKDQLPETLTDFYCLQEGVCIVEDDYGIALAMTDAPLLQTGPLEFGQRKLMGHPQLGEPGDRPPALYNWVMTNYWETNFEASLGGFHEFRYHLSWGAELAEPRRAIEQCRAMNLGFRAFRVR